mmetsp:Transcript_83814/g.201070  ORF Transcript_83814/g.201070 Transcript_83814/m.201070 type:complete len:225 (+) Transcript_83814:217-891(+)
MLHRDVRLDPAKLALPLHAFASDKVLANWLPQGLAATFHELLHHCHHLGPVSLFAAAPSAAPTAFALGVGLVGLCHQLLVGLDILQRLRCSTLLGLLLGGCQLPSPGALRPLAGQGRALDSGLEFRSNLVRNVDGLSLQQDLLGDLSNHGVQLGLRVVSRVRGILQPGLFGRWVLGAGVCSLWRARCSLGRLHQQDVGLQSLLRGRLLCALLIIAQVAGVLLAV